MSVTARARMLSSVHIPPRTHASAWQRLAIPLVTATAAATEMMSFLEHLDELRKRLIWALVSVAIAFAVCWAFSGQLYDIAAAPIRANPSVILSVSRPQDVFALSFKVTLVGALFLSAPFVLWQVWLFVSPGLYAHERRSAVPFVLAASVFFVLGGAFGYFIAFPAALTFLLDWTVSLHLTPIIDASAYFDLFFTVIISLGFVFQIPIAIFLLSRIGLVTARLLLVNLKYAIFAASVIAAVITPTTDPGNMLIIAGPMIALYVIGIPIAWAFGRRRADGEEPGT